MFVDLWLKYPTGYIYLVVRGHANNLLDNVLNFSKFNIFGQMALLMRDVMQKKAS